MKRFYVLPILMLTFFLSCKKPTNYTIISEPLESGTEASLRGLYVVNAHTIWASGSESTVLNSTNGGKDWQISHPDSNLKNDFRSIHAWNEQEALVFGISGPDFAYRTSDAGKTWNVVYSDTTQGLFFNTVKFADALNGLAVSDPIDGSFFVLKTNDAGRSWKRITTLPPTKAGEANFAASNTCLEFLPDGNAWIASGGSAARVFYSRDFGETWNVTETPMLQGDGAKGIYSISFKDAYHGIIVGGIYNHPDVNTDIAAYSNDGGITWLSSEIMPDEFRSCVQFLHNGTDDLALAIGKTGTNLSTDGGKTWGFITDIKYYTFRSIPQKLSGYAVGENGTICSIKIE